MARIEREPSASPLLRDLQQQLRATGRSPADEIRRLARLMDILSSGHNQIFGPIAALLLLKTQLAFAVESLAAAVRARGAAMAAAVGRNSKR